MEVSYDYLNEIGNGNVIWFCNYNHKLCMGSRNISIGIHNGNVIRFIGLVFGKKFGNQSSTVARF